MKISILPRPLRAICAGLAIVTGMSCTLQEQRAPAMTGPSEFGLAVTMAAVPDQLPRDGQSRANVVVTVRDSGGAPVAGRRLSVVASVGTLSQSEVVTGSNGTVAFTFTAPPAGSIGNPAVIQVLPVGDNFNNAVPRVLSIFLTGFSNQGPPSPSFTSAPASPGVGEAVVFDASATMDDGQACGLSCAYQWDFGDGTTGTGIVVTKAYSTPGAKAVTLTVTDIGGVTARLTRTIIIATPTAPAAGDIVFGPTPVHPNVVTNFDGGGATVGNGATIVEYTWSWGDGTAHTVSTLPQAQHTFLAVGTYTVRLTVRDNLGRTDTTTVEVEVEAVP